MYPQILGVYSRKQDRDIGFGTTTRNHAQQTYWFARRLSDDAFEVQPLNTSHVPSGMRTTLGKGEFIKAFHPEPGYYETRTLPALKSLQKKVEMGERFFQDGLLGQAEKEFLKAVMMDEDNAQANLGLGAVYSEQGRFAKVRKIVGILLNNDDAFRREQRRQFNTFGISLRRQGLHEDAIRFYSRALEVDPDDEHLHFNLARAHFELGDELACLQHIEIALGLNPDFKEGRKFLEYLGKHC
ncbi:tetratricopeptide repeat protein [Desulfocurvus sp.]|jgi:tetratricopeptide (TPR) repeat protein|uniref:tetratricopeptide repeat protein n=1 Tax=Desulfocurvus sp. TaxID=2871698 RepID=UPI0025BA473E|nr:tetratricopeptide repeat protein [Desulfocurvus sp.]MCK9240778.1 tetratricopeptide repeat protein [Desulfocurvus sp.]